MPSNTSDLLQGLNLIHPPPTPTSSATTDADILSAGPYADLAAQLDLWTNASFTSDEPFASGRGQDFNDPDGSDEKNQELMGGTASEIVKRKRDILAGKKNLALQQPQQQAMAPALGHPSPYDLPALLSMAAAGGSPFPGQSMNLNQLLALQAFPNPFHAAFGGGGVPVSFAQAPAFAAPTTMSTAPAKVESSPPTKRAKTRKTSTTTATVVSTRTSMEPPEDGDEDHDGDDGESSSRPGGGNMSEDKRRRNTQASARFRLKKKEREHAMEARSKELETKVGELEKECEALRRENGWLKGLVVGVTGGSGMPMSVTMPTGPMTLPASLPPPPPTTASSASSKRKRGDATEP